LPSSPLYLFIYFCPSPSSLEIRRLLPSDNA
jgi:hypothetical protein